MAILRLADDLWLRCTSIARAALPNEACALVAGESEHDGVLSVTNIYPVENSLRSATAFALDGAGMIAAEESIERAGKELLGVLHSHPTSQAVPSRRDLDDAGIYDPAGAFVHIIVSLQGFTPILRAFRYSGRGDVDIEFDIVRSARP